VRALGFTTLKAICGALMLIYMIVEPEPAHSFDLRDTLKQSESGFNSALKDGKRKEREAKQRAAEREQRLKNRDRSNDVCYSFPSGSDLQNACLNEYPNLVKNERARNLLLGYCSSMGDSSDLSNALSYICDYGRKGCSLLGEAAYHCDKCGATPRWLAVYSLGSLIQCYG